MPFFYIEMETLVLEEVMWKPQLSYIALWPKAPKPQRENLCLSTCGFSWTHCNFGSLVRLNWSILQQICLKKKQKWQGLGSGTPVPRAELMLAEHPSGTVSNIVKTSSWPSSLWFEMLFGRKNGIFNYCLCLYLAVNEGSKEWGMMVWLTWEKMAHHWGMGPPARRLGLMKKNGLFF